MEKPDRPYIFCHMETALDGKIMGKYLWIPEIDFGSDSFYDLIIGDKAHYEFEALLNGRTTIEDNFTFYKTPQVDENTAPVPDGDFIAPNDESNKYLLVADTKGRVAWETNKIEMYEGKFEVVEVITEQASNAYKSYLRDKGIGYLICGTDKIDEELVCQKAKDLLKVNTMMLGGGAVINWSFMQKGLVDEMSLLMAPAADGCSTTQPLFLAKEGLTDDQPIIFDPTHIELMPDKKIWMRFNVGAKSAHDFGKDEEYQAVQEMIKANS